MFFEQQRIYFITIENINTCKCFWRNNKEFIATWKQKRYFELPQIQFNFFTMKTFNTQSPLLQLYSNANVYWSNNKCWLKAKEGLLSPLYSIGNCFNSTQEHTFLRLQQRTGFIPTWKKETDFELSTMFFFRFTLF